MGMSADDGVEVAGAEVGVEVDEVVAMDVDVNAKVEVGVGVAAD
jgi:hypothetical protein